MDLATVMRKEFSTAKRCWLWIILLQVLLLAGAIYAILGASGSTLLVIGLAGLLVPVITFWLKEVAGFHYGLGERIRRLLVIHDGLGRSPSAKEMLEICADCTSVPSLDPRPLGKYYDSPLPEGPQRMAHIIEESAFYTRKLASVASLYCAAFTAAGILATITLIWYGLQMTLPTELPPAGGELTSEKLARLLSAFLVFFAAGTFASLWRSYKSLAEAARKIFDKCDLLRQDAGVDQLDVLVAVGSYDSSLAKAPPLPRVIYWLCRTRLHRAWREHMSTS